MVAVFYGGELVWRERDRGLNELLDSTPVASWVMTVPKILAIFVVLLVINLVGMATGLFYMAVAGAPAFGIPQYLGWFILPAAIDGLLIAVLAVVVQVLSPNKYVGWGVIFVWFVGTIFLSNMGYSNPLYMYDSTPSVPLSDFVGAGSFWKGALTLQFYWACFARYPRCPCPPAMAARHRCRRAGAAASGCAVMRLLHRWRSPASRQLAMAATGAYAYHNIKVLNRYQTSDEAEKFSADYERKYLKYERLPQPAVTKVTMDVELFPKERRLIVNGRYDLKNKTAAPIRDIHVRAGQPRHRVPQARYPGRAPRLE